MAERELYTIEIGDRSASVQCITELAARVSLGVSSVLLVLATIRVHYVTQNL